MRPSLVLRHLAAAAAFLGAPAAAQAPAPVASGIFDGALPRAA